MHFLRVRTHRFRDRLFNSVFILFFLFIACFFIFQYKREKVFRQEILNNILVEYSDLVYRQIKLNGPDFKKLRLFVNQNLHPDLRITILNKQGKVLFDSGEYPEIVNDNHISRPEIQKAIRSGNGIHTRKSATYQIPFFYSATLYEDQYLIRCSIPYNSHLNNEMRLDKSFVYFSIFMLLLIATILLYYSNRLSKSIDRLKQFATQADRNESLDLKELSFPSDELGEISCHIIQLYNKVAHTKDALYTEREKLITHLQFSKEGLSIYTSQMEEILANNLFIQYITFLSDQQINTSTDVFRIKELQSITLFIHRHLDPVQPSPFPNLLSNSLKVSKNGKTFLVECLIFQDKSFEIAINDITQEEEESRLKRQLTQNISHELKTPVSSIMGYIETMLNNPHLPAEKRELFTERCYTQTIRLTHLLSDISLINRMDEARNLFEKESVDLIRVIHEVKNDVALSLQEKQMVCQIHQQPSVVKVRGNYALLYSIFRNLTDNAIAYAGEGCTIDISCYREDADYFYFSFADNGCGIEEKHLTHIFERFYRVDKGRTRKMGGTGLGLSIVKNAIAIHQGSISAKNRVEGGLAFLFSIAK